MLCCVCKQKEAVVHYAEIVDGAIQKQDLCEQCAVEKGLGSSLTFSMGDMLAGITDQNTLEKGATVCPQCNMTLEEFRKCGRFGCDKCYELFSETLTPMLEQIHRSTKHKGKVPVSLHDESYKRENIATLEKELKEAIETEDFEKAAYLRDELKRMKQS